MIPDLICHDCATVYPAQTLAWRCACGGLFDMVDTLMEPVVPTENRLSMWRYSSVLPVSMNPILTLGEGLTPLVPDAVYDNVYFKCDYLMPTGSFKDRGAAVLATLAADLNIQRAVIDSSGNAATAMAAYFARAGIPLDVYVPAGTSITKLAQLDAYGATVHLGEGNRAVSREMAMEAADVPATFYASHVFHPYFFAGVKTVAYEVYEQYKNRLPSIIFIPAGNGTLVLGWAQAIDHMVATGMIPAAPHIVVVQSEACAPLAGSTTVGPTIVEGLSIPAPPRAGQILETIRSLGGKVMTVRDDEVLGAQRELARQGFFVEPTAAACYAAFLGSDFAHGEDDVLIPLCGTGLKSVARVGHRDYVDR